MLNKGKSMKYGSLRPSSGSHLTRGQGCKAPPDWPLRTRTFSSGPMVELLSPMIVASLCPDVNKQVYNTIKLILQAKY